MWPACFLVLALSGFLQSSQAEHQPVCHPSASEACAPQSQPSSFQFDPNASILTYLNPAILGDEKRVQEMSKAIQRGDLVIVEDAFDPLLAEYLWEDLQRDDLQWELMQGAHDDGFHFHHHNIPEDGNGFTERMTEVYGMFNHSDSKAFMSNFTGRDCNGSSILGGSSYYKPGDHSLPHSDYDGQRTVAFVWHLTKDWTPEWGGALYFCPAHAYQPFVHASFNTLHLFSVTPNSTHFVTVVSPEAQGKRLAFNGWYESEWVPTSVHEVLDLSQEEQSKITAAQLTDICEMDTNDASLSLEDQDRLEFLQDGVYAQLGNDEGLFTWWA